MVCYLCDEYGIEGKSTGMCEDCKKFVCVGPVKILGPHGEECQCDCGYTICLRDMREHGCNRGHEKRGVAKCFPKVAGTGSGSLMFINAARMMKEESESDFRESESDVEERRAILHYRTVRHYVDNIYYLGSEINSIQGFIIEDNDLKYDNVIRWFSDQECQYILSKLYDDAIDNFLYIFPHYDSLETKLRPCVWHDIIAAFSGSEEKGIFAQIANDIGTRSQKEKQTFSRDNRHNQINGIHEEVISPSVLELGNAKIEKEG